MGSANPGRRPSPFAYSPAPIVLGALLVAVLFLGFAYYAAPRRANMFLLAGFVILLALLGGALLTLFSRRQRALARHLAELERSEASYRTLVQDALYGIYRRDERGLVFANAALVRMLGYESEADLLALDLSRDLLAEAGGDGQTAEARPPLLLKDAEASEQTWKRKDGSHIKVRVSGRALRDAQGRLFSFEGMVEDVSTRHALEQQLRHSEKLAALGRLVAGAAHEINNPLTAIMGYAELLSSDPAATPQQRDFAEKIRLQARRTRAITASMQNFSRQELASQSGLLDLNAIVTNALRIQELKTGGNAIRFRLQLAPALPRVAGDEYQLLEVCMHILNNSVDALRSSGGVITARTANQGEMVLLEFSDNGPGIHDLERAFDPFYTTKPVGDGAGLGLSNCYGIVKAHAGAIECHNLTGGGAHGAVITIRLPVAAAR